ncbi:MAG: tripartite tricarboxylate transporter substrate binding protein, partial [Rhodospirillaceae bacterium]
MTLTRPITAMVLATCPLVTSAADMPQAYPTKPLRFVVGFAPGGGTDTVARILAQKLGEAFGQSVVVDNRAGAGGNIANALVATAPADGYTILFVSASFAIHPSLYRKLPYDPAKDFTPVSLASSSPYLLALHPSVPVRSVRDLIAFAKSQPGKLNYASAGAGSTLHLAAELFKSMAGVDIVHVPYKGANGITDLIAGAVQLTFAGLPQTLPHVKAGRLHGLAVTTSQRAAAIPELPTIAEAGVPGYEVDSWYGVLEPAGTLPARVEKLSGAIRSALREPDVKAKFAAQGLEPRGTSPGDFGAYIAREMPKWAK